MHLIDTNVISEAPKKSKANPGVMEFFSRAAIVRGAAARTGSSGAIVGRHNAIELSAPSEGASHERPTMTEKPLPIDHERLAATPVTAARLATLDTDEDFSERVDGY